MTENHLITREIGIDMAHRVTYHGSKCRNMHGHRYTIQATCIGPLFTSGEQQGMVLDFGFLKDAMMRAIDNFCDHGTVLWKEDPILQHVLRKDLWFRINCEIKDKGYCWLVGENEIFTKLYIVDFVPTAENLARHWYHRLAPLVEELSEWKASLLKIVVFETPNCSAEYIGDQ